jgi:hypothetical protein
MSVGVFFTPNVAYVHTHLAATSGEIADAMSAYVGKTMTAGAYDRGAVKNIRFTLLKSEAGKSVIDYKGRELTVDTWDLFANRCTHVFK